MGRTMHTLIATTDDRDLRNREQCSERDHLPLTFNPWMAETFCRCGAARYPGNLAPMHAVRCFGDGCDDECPQAVASGRAMLPVPAGQPLHPRPYRVA